MAAGAGLWAQNPAGEIRLEVKDPSGAAVEASGKLEGRTTAVNRTFGTDAQGVAGLDNLPLGRYRVEVSKTGFATQSLTVDISAPKSVTVSVTLALSAQASKIDVVATTPLAGSDLPLELIASPVQTATSRDLDASGALELGDLMNRRLNGVHINETQDNPFQPDVNYRGYTASPLLGTPEGISVYMDGVRLNQPFGDVVSWDLIPSLAISEVALIPGSNPLFGLNTLGGALSVETKDGFSHPGTEITVLGGQFGRRAVEFEHGGSTAKGFNWYVAGNLFHEDGWRAESPSDVRQSFAKVGWQRGKTFVGLTGAYADNELLGNGLQEQRFIASDYTSVYTKPDVTWNHSPFLNLTARRILAPTLTLSGNAYFRFIRADTFNGDLNEDSLDQSIYQPSAADIRALAAAGYTGFPTSGATAANTPFPFWRCIAQVLQNDEPAEKCDGLLNRTYSWQNNYGVSGQMTWLASRGSRRNQLTAGAAYDRSSVTFQQTTQLGYLNPDRSVTGVNAFGDGGVTGGTVDDVPFDNRVNLHGTPHTGSVYATDTLSLGRDWNFTVSGRYNRTTIDNLDRITPGGGPGSLNGHSVFDRFNPAAGVTYNPTPLLNVYFSYSEGSRAPTSIELGCADPTQPCKLPNALAGDPPLDQVVTRTFEAGVRGSLEAKLHWNAGWFRGENYHDILFVASTQTGFGYFKNFGKTLRQGVEVNLDAKIRTVTLGGDYTFLDATYRSTETIDGSSNSTNDAALGGTAGLDGTIEVQPGDHIPLMPQHLFKAYANWQVTAKLSFDLGFVAASTSYARGNENNLSQADGKYYLGPGTSPGYGVVNLSGRYQVQKHLQLFGQIGNLLDHRYYTAAQLGPTGFSDQFTVLTRPLPAVNGEFPLVHATFYAPSAPRTVWGGVRVSF
jgi:outer membrane receptor protein involved in Fe transport